MTFRYDFIASRSTFINSVSMRDICVCAIALYFQIERELVGELQKEQTMGMFVHGDDFVSSFAHL